MPCTVVVKSATCSAVKHYITAHLHIYATAPVSIICKPLLPLRIGIIPARINGNTGQAVGRGEGKGLGLLAAVGQRDAYFAFITSTYNLLRLLRGRAGLSAGVRLEGEHCGTGVQHYSVRGRQQSVYKVCSKICMMRTFSIIRV